MTTEDSATIIVCMSILVMTILFVAHYWWLSILVPIVGLIFWFSWGIKKS